MPDIAPPKARPQSHGAPRNSPAVHPRQDSEIIRSRENQWVKRFRAALRNSAAPATAPIRRYHDTSADVTFSVSIGVEGPHLVAEALRAAAEGALTIEAVLVNASGERHLSALGPRLGHVPGARESTPPVRPAILRTTEEIFRSVAGTETPQGIAALVRLRQYSLDDMVHAPNPLLVVMMGVQDPGNMGTAIRSAEAFAANGLIAAKGTAHPWSQKALRASSGSVLRLPILEGIAPQVLMAQLQVMGLRLCAACLHPPAGCAVASPEETDLRGPVALLIGSEGAGLDDSVQRFADALVRVPLAAPVESLNAGVAASLLLYEAARQRGKS